MTRAGLRAAAALLIVTAAAACGKNASSSSSPPPPKSSSLTVLTPAATGSYPSPITWGVYREVSSLDPIFAFDYPENTRHLDVCESLLRQQPDGSIKPGLGDGRDPDPTHARDHAQGRRRSSGTASPMTADDVVYSLDRARDPKLGGFYRQVFARVKSIKTTGPHQVTITLTRARLLAAAASCPRRPAWWSRRRSSSKGQEVRHGRRAARCAPARSSSSRGRPARASTVVTQRRLLGPGAQAPQCRDRRSRASPDDAAITSGLLTGELQRLLPASS